MNKVLRHFKKNAVSYITLFVGLALVTTGYCADDPLAKTMKPEVAALFGSGSTISYCIYIAEIVLGGISYVRSKNLLILLGVPILMIFTHTMFSLISTAPPP